MALLQIKVRSGIVVNSATGAADDLEHGFHPGLAGFGDRCKVGIDHGGDSQIPKLAKCGLG